MKKNQLLIGDLLFFLTEEGIFLGTIFNGYIILKIFPFLYSSISFLEIYIIMSFPLALYLIYSYFQTKDGFYVFITLIRLLQLIIIVFISILTPFVFTPFIVNITNLDWQSVFLLFFFLVTITIAVMFYKKLLSYAAGKDISSVAFFFMLLYILIMLSGAFYIFPGISAI